MGSPKISFLVVVYRMSRQAENTLLSLSSRFQQNVSEEDYEIIAVENRSDDVLGEERALAVGNNVRYFLRDEATQTPVFALNFAFEQSRAPLVCLIIDGARMVTPRLVEHALYAQRLVDHPLIAVPGYHLGPEEQHKNVTSGYDEKVEAELLERIDWKNNGYDLFKIACFSGANAKGYLAPMLECNCLFCTREAFEKIGRADERFDLPGGGSVNLHIYTKLAALQESKLIVLGGEGSFHQFHGGVTTAEIDEREAVLESHRLQLRAINGGTFEGVHREPLMLGVVPGQAQEFLKLSAGFGAFHHAACKQLGWPEWYDARGL
jgi:glycosyltransferase involved in cell wall biosynthesis